MDDCNNRHGEISCLGLHMYFSKPERVSEERVLHTLQIPAHFHLTNDHRGSFQHLIETTAQVGEEDGMRSRVTRK